MFGVPIPVIQLIIVLLRALGVTSWAENLSLKAITKAAKTLSNLKSYHADADFPSSPMMQTNIHKFTVGEKP